MIKFYKSKEELLEELNEKAQNIKTYEDLENFACELKGRYFGDDIDVNDFINLCNAISDEGTRILEEFDEKYQDDIKVKR